MKNEVFSNECRGVAASLDDLWRYGGNMEHQDRKNLVAKAASLLTSAASRVDLEEGYIYWTHEGHVARRKSDDSGITELLGPGGWSPAL
jgi:hypothetical protein